MEKEKKIYRSYEELPLALTVMQVADVLGISRAGAYELIHTDGFPCIRIGEGRYVIPKEKFIQWLEQSTETTERSGYIR